MSARNTTSVYDGKTESIRCKACNYSHPIPKHIQDNPLRILMFKQEFDRLHALKGHLVKPVRIESVRILVKLTFNPISFDFGGAVRSASRGV